MDVRSSDALKSMSMTEEERAYRASCDPAHIVEVDEAGRTQLHLAAGLGKAAVCRIYITAGCDPSTRDNSGRTPADLAKAAGYFALARSLEALLIQADVNGASAQVTRQAGPLNAVEQRGMVSGDNRVIIAIIADRRLDCRNAKGDTPFHLAAAGGHLTACNTLFEAGADPTARNHANQTPAEMAAEAGYLDLARLLGGPEPEAPISTPFVQTHNGRHPVADNDLQSFGSAPALDMIEFDPIEDPGHYHARQQINPASARFSAIFPRTEMRSCGPEENDEWELPASIAKVGATGSSQYLAIRPTDHGHGLDFSHSASSRRSRRPRKLKNTRFALPANITGTWAAEALSAGTVDEQAIRDLVGACSGNHDGADLKINVRKVLIAAGIDVMPDGRQFRPFPTVALDLVDVSALSEAIDAACTRDTAIPGSGPFNLDRATEERILREIGNARRSLLAGILDNPGVLAEVVRRCDLVLSGELAPDELTDLDLELDGDEENVRNFSDNIEIVRNALEEGVENGGRARRNAVQALGELEIRRHCLVELASIQGKAAEAAIRRLITTCDGATEELVFAHLSYMRRETAKMARADEDPEELFQEAYFGLRRASERFDPERGIRFYLYALLWIRQRISRWRADQGSLIRVPVHRAQLNAKIMTYAEEFERTHSRSPTDSELSTATGCEVDMIKSLESALSEPIWFDQVAVAIPSPVEAPDETMLRSQVATMVNRELDELPEREQAVIRMRFGIGRDSEMTLEEIGQIYSVTRERIRQIEAKGLERLKHPSRRRFWRELR